ncbi:BED zinc finger [Phytophthora infestans]|uniref:BED zinc finger n=1 Tax=Phytophthora infestans TaxID=4787 RepID=A0A833SKL4_PHYIN|nr:BED zinc finger [Phytophthora infestans]KAF4133447.1 BED zinc finger [Phytophthora infestans]
MSFYNKLLTNKLVCVMMFTKKSKEDFVCSTCTKNCKRAHGYTNLISHLRTYHTTYLEDAAKAAKDRNALRLCAIDDETRTIFRWCEWVVLDRLPLNFIERKMTRENACLPTISAKTVKLYLLRIFESTEGRVTEELLLSFGIVKHR